MTKAGKLGRSGRGQRREDLFVRQQGRGPGMVLRPGNSEPPPDQQQRINLKAAQASSLVKKPKKITLAPLPWDDKS